MTISFEHKVQAASKKAAQVLTKDLRQYLVALGWPPQAASAVTLDYDMGSFKVDITGQHSDDAKILEYGSPGFRPTAAIRKYFNRDSRLKDIYFSLIEKEVGEKL